MFADLTIVGLHSVEIRALGDDLNTVDSPLSAEFLFERKSIYDEAPTGVAVYDYFIIENYQESTRYIFYTNMTYQFNPEYTFEILTGTGLVQLPNSYSLKMGSISGTFRFRMNRPNGTSSVYDALIVKDIKGFAYGDNYQTYLTETSLNSSYLDIDALYYVGAGSDFYLDLRMTSTQGNRIKLEDVLLDYTFYIFDGAWVELLGEELEDTIVWKPNNRFQFTSDAIGKTYRIAVTPRYKSLNMTAPILNYDVVVNEGVNVFTNQELKDAFANFDVSVINIHANITATLSQSQLNPDGSPKNTNNGAGNVYNRFDPNNKSDNLTIEGNFMTINGSNLPYANERSGSGKIPFAGSFVIVVVRIAIFNYNMGWSGGEPYQTPDPNFHNDSQFTMNNLTIIGNTTVPSVNFGGSAEDILLQERLMSRNSGGHMGVLVMGGSSTFNNVQVKFTTLAFSTSAYGLKSNDKPVKMELNKVKVDDNWANGLYMQGATLTVVNDSWFGQSGGSAFHISDNRQVVESTIRESKLTNNC